MDDATRIREYLEGTPAAFNEVDSWIRAEGRRSYAGLRDELEDLFQTVHGRLLENLRAGRFEGRSALRTYVTGIVHRTAIAYLRQHYRARLFDDSGAETLAAWTDNPYRAVEIQDERRRVRHVLSSLPEICRTLWKLVFLEHLGYEEVGRRLAVPPGTIKSRMWHCRRKAVAALERLARRGRARPKGHSGQ